MGGPHGFWLLARSAADGVAVAQLLLELGRLKGWRLAGMGLVNKWCIDLMP